MRNATQQRIRNGFAVTWVRDEVEEPGVDWIRQRACAGDDPDGADALDGARATAGALAPDGMADGQVALYGEPRDGQHGGVGSGLHEERLEQAELHAEVPGVGLPDREQFRRKCWRTERIKDLLK